jgi:hypothetical protein
MAKPLIENRKNMKIRNSRRANPEKIGDGSRVRAEDAEA